MTELFNGKQCVGVEITSDTMAAFAAARADLAELDTGGVLPANTDADWNRGDDDDYDALMEQELEGQEQANAQCRMEYDLNSQEGGFCCQAMAFDVEDMDTATGYFASSTKIEAGAEEIVVDFDGTDVDILIGAELFASASGMGASFLTLAASVLVFSQ